MALSERP